MSCSGTRSSWISIRSFAMACASARTAIRSSRWNASIVRSVPRRSPRPLDSIVQYARWMESRQPGDWKNSPILKGIRDYNEDDCRSTAELLQWLRKVADEQGIAAPKPAPHRLVDATRVASGGRSRRLDTRGKAPSRRVTPRSFWRMLSTFTAGKKSPCGGACSTARRPRAEDTTRRSGLHRGRASHRLYRSRQTISRANLSLRSLAGMQTGRRGQVQSDVHAQFGREVHAVVARCVRGRVGTQDWQEKRE